jgi:glycine cleavage system H lipoate-binding protein
MEGTTDIFATKGIEYLIVIAYLVLLVGFWKLLTRPHAAEVTAQTANPASAALRGWFQLRDGLFFHQGHTWAMPEGGDILRIGADDFAMKLLGQPETISLPSIGSHLRQGEAGWEVGIDSKFIPMLSPVDGEVVQVNGELQTSPELVNTEPYDRGWLMKVRVREPRATLRNLLSGELARSWIDETTERLRQMQAGELGIVMPDGGAPVDGFARILSPDHWDDLARELLLSD